MKLRERKNLILVFFLLAAVLAVKAVCFWRGFPEYYDDTVESILSGVYYILMLGLCFFAGREKWGFSIAACAFLVKLLILGVTVVTGWQPLIVVFRFLSASHYLLTEAVHSFENVGQTLPDIIYWGAYLLMYVCFAAVAKISTKLEKRKQK